MHPASFTGLYWSIRGEVACADHAPEIVDPRWAVEGWAPVPVSAGPVQRSRYQCQHCATDGRALVCGSQHSRSLKREGLTVLSSSLCRSQLQRD